LRIALELGAPAPGPELLVNDLQDAARALCPEIDGALLAAREAGADAALVSGSGPTVVGLFTRANGPGRAARAVAALADRTPAPIAAAPVGADFGAPAVSSVRHN
jgi:4-diphosphocytidyl-2-C-methyl-D-erythritol kinase